MGWLESVTKRGRYWARLVGLLVLFVALLGMAVGSFLNVVIYRVPRGVSVVSPPSRCPKCGVGIRAIHNIPVAGWLILRGRCASCRISIGARYPLVEMSTGLLFVAVTLRLDALHLVYALAPWLYFCSMGVALAAIDLETRRLPNAIVLPSYCVVGALLVLVSGMHGAWWPLARAGIGAVILLGFYLTLVVVYPSGMGWGDVKLAPICGALLAYLSWSALLVGGFGAFVMGAVVGVVAMLIGGAGRKTALPFGPFMIGATIAALFVASPLADVYLDHVGR